MNHPYFTDMTTMTDNFSYGYFYPTWDTTPATLPQQLSELDNFPKHDRLPPHPAHETDTQAFSQSDRKSVV